VRGVLALAVLLALVAGLPWALVHYVGWPLPGHVPTWDEVQATLLNPMSDYLLLDVLAVVCWIVWAFFVLDVARCSLDAARGITWPQVRPPGPLHGIAAALIGTVVLTLLSNRAPSATPTIATAVFTSNLAPVAVTAPVTPGASTPAPTAAQQSAITINSGAPAPPGMVQVTAEVQLPHNSIYDSLWRIAERVYGPGGGNRWPELFQLNRGVTQPDGRTLTNPCLIRPGWHITAYIPAPPEQQPGSPQQPQVPSHQIPPRQPAPTSTAPTAPATPKASPTPSAAGHGDQHNGDRATQGVSLSTGAFVSLGLAAAIAAALLSARMWRRRRYRVGSGDRDDLQRPIAPVVRALRAAHDEQEDRDDPHTVDDVEYLDLSPAPPRIHVTSAGNLAPDDEPVPVPARVGVRGGYELALNLASTRGLGLAGPGATDAARALLLHLLAEPRHAAGPCAIIPADDLHLVFDDTVVDDLPTTVLVVDSLDAALDEMESTLLTRTRHAIEESTAATPLTPCVLIATSQPHAERRLQAVLDNGAPLGLAGILLGQWRPGATVRVRADGAVSATSPGLCDELVGTRLFTLGSSDANALLAVLRDAEGPVDEQPIVATPRRPADGEDEPPRSGAFPKAQDVTPPSTTAPTTHTVSTQLESGRPAAATDSADTATTEHAPDLQLLDGRTVTVHVEPEQASPAPTAPPDDLGLAPDAPDDEHRASPAPEPPSRDAEDAPEPQHPLAIHVLGRVHLLLRDDEGEHDLSGVLTPKQREVLVYLALHRNGVRRETLNEAVWPDSRPPRPYNSFHNTLSMLRRAVSDATDSRIANLVVNDDGRYRLNNDLTSVDVWQLQNALRMPSPVAGADQARLLRAAELYEADLAEDLTVPWIEPFREALRRDVLDALGTLVRTYGDNDPDVGLALLERMRALDKYNEGTYRDIIRTQARLGQHDAVPRTLALLTATLDEIEQRPSADTLNLIDFLQRRSTRRPAPGTAAAS
jgi:DNA-binding SARP family transcriptional activator